MIKVAPIDNPAAVRSVSENSWKHWPNAKEVPGAKMAGRDIMVVVTEEDVALAKARAERAKEPTVPPEVLRIKAAEIAAEVSVEAAAEEQPEKRGPGRPKAK